MGASARLHLHGQAGRTMPQAPHLAPTTILRAHLAEMASCWLEIRCGTCGAATMMPIGLLIRRHGPDVLIGAILARLSCRRCRVPPVAVWLNETPHRTPGQGLTPSWSVPLLGDALSGSDQDDSGVQSPA